MSHLRKYPPRISLTSHRLWTGLSAFTIAIITGIFFGPTSCKTNPAVPDPEHCQDNDGDRFCHQKYPDANEHRWYCELGGCWSEGRPTDGCLTEIPERKDECYKPCGMDVSWEDCNYASTDTSTSDDATTGSDSDVGSESGSETSSGGICGDGVQDGGEECDDGNKENDDACTNFCTTAVCGDKMIQLDEECDDGNQSNEDGCLNNCKYASCGDGEVRVDMEECDDGNQDNGDGCSAACRKECGDGMWNSELEECDDGNTIDGDGCSASCEDERKVVFVTSMPTPSGNLGGISGADGICQMAADGASLQGTFRAWLSDDNSSPSMWANERSLPYIRLDGEEVAADWEDLVDESLANSINVTENGVEIVEEKFAWTNTKPDGTLNNGDYDCKGWTVSKVDVGGQGKVTESNSTWTQTEFPASCGLLNTLHLYCFEQ